MLLTKEEATEVFTSLVLSQRVKATLTLNFNAHKKGRVIVRHTAGYGVVVEGYSSHNGMMPFSREIYDNNQHFISTYEQVK